MTAAVTDRAHGYARYKRSGGCRCNVCGYATSEYNARRLAAIAAGTWQPYVDAAPAREHIARLAAVGVGPVRIARLSGVSRSTIKDVKSGATRRVRPEVAASLLAVPAVPMPRTPVGLDATGTKRRIGARAAQGWTLTHQARELGMSIHNISDLMRQKWVTPRMAQRVADVYDRMCWQLPPDPDSPAAKRSRLWAARHGYPVPLAWDDETIDDPAASPEGVPARDPDELDPVRVSYVCAGKPVPELTKAERHAAAVALMAAGHTLKETSRRVHLDRRTVHKLLTEGTS